MTLLIDRVIINDVQVKIRYVVPTGPKGETTPFCHLRLDYPNAKSFGIQTTRLLGGGRVGDQIQQVFIAFGPTTDGHNRTIGFLCQEHLREVENGHHGLIVATPVNRSANL